MPKEKLGTSSEVKALNVSVFKDNVKLWPHFPYQL